MLDLFESLPPGTFLDFGCGSGDLLTEAKRRGWHAVGVEFSADVAEEVARRVDVQVVTTAQLSSVGPVDIAYLGDVIEHLVGPLHELKRILGLMETGGLVVAQGPLEANASLFTWAVRVVRAVRPTRTEMPPYHVLLATADGQRRLFERAGLEPVEFDVTEVSWPAPDRLTLSDLRDARRSALFALRRVSRAVSRLRPGRWGNRYFYVGRVARTARRAEARRSPR